MYTIKYQDSDYDPYESLPEDLVKMLVRGFGGIGIVHALYRGRGLAVVDLVEDLLQIADRDYWLPDEFFLDWHPVKDVADFEVCYVKWSDYFNTLISI
jgi:hypothetical protein